MTTPLLEAFNVRKTFGGLLAVNDVSFNVPHRQIVSVIGPNGAGKTTFFNLITGIYRPTSGSIRFDGKDLVGLRPDQIAAVGIARTFQNIRLFGGMTVLENVLVGRHARLPTRYIDALLHTRRYRDGERSAIDKATELLQFVGLDDKANELSRNLPYGEQRRLEIARALASDPKLILLDEPSAGMNPHETDDAKKLIRQLRDQFDLTVVLIEHDMRLVMTISDSVTVLDYGQKIAEGTPAQVRADAHVITAYLGRGEATGKLGSENSGQKSR
ncbi:MAG: ABC transporter ATP-binding protein [Gammaproteobacteria bacterium]|nr:ABC transporter ATP-binding protein [Gammaproteobacteria bacterium]